jgi:hypothetical protein
MRGSIIVTFDELIEGIGGAYFDVRVNNVIRDRHFTNISNLYSSGLNLNETFNIIINTEPQICVFTFNLIRRDYTTDDTNGNMGIIDTYITGITSTDTIFTSPTFTATTRPDAYDFEYRVNLEITPINPISGQILAGVVQRDGFNNYNYLSTNTGTTFSQMTSLGADEWWDIGISDIGTYMSAVGESDIPTVYRSVNTGSTWTTITGFTESTLLKHIDMSTTGQFQIAGGVRGDNYNSYVYVSTDYGATWGMKKQLSDRIGAFAISNNGKYMIAGEVVDSGSGLINKYVYISDNYGQIWSTLTSLPTDVFAYDLVTVKPGWIGGAISYNGQYITVANGAGQLYVSNNYGQTFTRRINDWIVCPLPGGASALISTQFHSINMSYSGQYQTALANSWGGPEPLCFNNSIWRSSDFGVTWTETSYTGNWGKTNESGALKVSASGQIQFAAKAQFTTYPPTQNPGLFLSTDYGVTWNELTSAPNTYWIGVGMNK